MTILKPIASLLAVFLCLMLGSVALSAESDSVDVSIAVGAHYNLTSTGTANLAITEGNYNTVGEYNFINNGITLGVSVNMPWRIKAQLNQNMPTSPGGGYTLRVDDNRQQGDISGWSDPLSTTAIDLPFSFMDAPVHRNFVLDWRIEGLTEADGATPLSRTVTFTIYSTGNF